MNVISSARICWKGEGCTKAPLYRLHVICPRRARVPPAKFRRTSAMQPSVKLIADIYAAFSRGDTGFIVASVRDDVDWNHSKSPEIPYGGHYNGPKGVTTFFERIARAVRVTAF